MCWVSIGKAFTSSCSVAAPLHFHRTSGNTEVQFTSSSSTSGTSLLISRARRGGETSPCIVWALPPFLQAELQPLFCSAPRGVLSPSTMKSVTFKLLYCDLGTCALSVVTRRRAPAFLPAPSLTSIDQAPRCNQRRQLQGPHLYLFSHRDQAVN